MAAIGKIREQSTLLLIVIGGAMVAFVLGDIFTGTGGGRQDQYVGEVYGEEINLVDFERRVDAEKQSIASIGQSSGQDEQIRNQVWNDMIQEKVMYSEMNKLGLRIGQDEFDDIRFGENVLDDFKNNPNFQNPETGQFDPRQVQNYFAVMQTNFPLYYESQVNRLVNERLYQKYNTMLLKGEYVNTLEAKDEYYRQEQEVSFEYVAREYESVPDSTIQVTDSELRAYYNKHKNEERFERDGKVNFKYVVFDVNPSKEDIEAIKDELRNLKNDFKNAKNDSLFAVKYSRSRSGNLVDLKGEDNDELQAMMDSAEEGDVIGPYKVNDSYAIAKIKTKGTEDRATARHILLSNQSESDIKKLKARADSIKRVIERNNNFEEMVMQFSEDPGSVANGGKYENFDRLTMVEEFTEASFDKPIGSINIVETTYGVHIVEPLEHKKVAVVQARVVDEPASPSNRTFNEVYDEANTFSIDASNLSGMLKLAEEKGYEVKEAKDISLQARIIPGVAGSLDAIRWAHSSDKSKPNQVSQPFEFDRKIVVLGLETRTKPGRAEFEDVKEEIKADVILEKKVKMFKDEMKGKSFDELTAEFNIAKKTATNLSEKRPSLPGGAGEGYVVGYALSLAEGDMSEPIKGNKGVYVIQVMNKSEVAARDDYSSYGDELLQNRRNGVRNYNQGLYRALKDYANVKDERSRAF